MKATYSEVFNIWERFAQIDKHDLTSASNLYSIGEYLLSKLGIEI
jgi:hypothetical protein